MFQCARIYGTEAEGVNTNLLVLKNCRPIACIPCSQSGCCELSAVKQRPHWCVHQKPSLLVDVEVMLVNMHVELLVFRHHCLLLPHAVANATPNLVVNQNLVRKQKSGSDLTMNLFFLPLNCPLHVPNMTAAGLGRVLMRRTIRSAMGRALLLADLRGLLPERCVSAPMILGSEE